VLRIRAAIAPDDGAGGHVDGHAILGDALAVAFHVQLLQIGGEAAQILVVGRDGNGAAIEELAVPEAHHGQHHGHVLFQRGLAEVLVHRMRAGEEIAEVFKTHGQRHGQADRRPDGIAATDPVPEREHIVRRNAEVDDGLRVGRDGHEVLRQVLFFAFEQEPGTRRVGVKHGFSGDEGFRGHDEQGRFRIDLRQGRFHVVPVDVGHKMHFQARIGIRAQRQASHFRTQVRAADADVDDVANWLARVAEPAAIAYLVRKCLHALQHILHVGIDILAIDHQLRAAWRAQGGMQNGPMFGKIDFLAGEHGFALRFHAAFACQVHQQAHGGGVDTVLRVIEQQSCRIDRHRRETCGFKSEQLAQMHFAQAGAVRLQGLETGGGGDGRSRCWLAHGGRLGCLSRLKGARCVRRGEQRIRRWYENNTSQKRNFTTVCEVKPILLCFF